MRIEERSGIMRRDERLWNKDDRGESTEQKFGHRYEERGYNRD